MNLPQLTAKIGQAWADEDVYSVLYQEPRVKQEEDRPQYLAFMIFDLDRLEINFELQPFNSEAIRRYKYFGNNKAAAKQFHVVREGKDLHYLLNLWNNLRELLEAQDLKDLAGQLAELTQVGLIQAGTGNLSLDKLDYALRNPELELQYDQKKKRIIHKTPDKVEEITLEVLIKKAVSGTNKDQIVLVVPQIKQDDKLYEISNHADYLNLIKQFHKLGEEDNKKAVKRKQPEITEYPSCYICGQKKDGIACVEYSTKLRRDGINKIFTTTTINYAKNIDEAGYEHNYSFCKDCFADLRQGEKVILNRLSTRLAGERTFILPEGLLKDFEYKNIAEIKKEIDFVFKPNKAEEWINGVGAETRWLQLDYFNLNFIIYDTDGNSVTVLQTISDVSNRFLMEIIAAFKKHLLPVTKHLRYFSLGSIYRVIPVKVKKDGQQVDVGRVLSFYKSILKREKVKTDLVYRYAAEALDKGLKQLAANEIRNYFNLELRRYAGGKEDFYIKKTVFAYLVILHVLQDLEILSDMPFKEFTEEERKNMGEKLKQDGCPESVWEAEKFLEEQNFAREARALFYLGLIMKRVVIAQASKGHKNKPVLKKVNFQGMSAKDILHFYEELVEKLRQYNKINFYTEWLMNRFHYYMGPALTIDDWSLNDHANVFFIMSGYAFQVGKKYSPDLTQKEQQAIEEENVNILTEGEDENVSAK